MSKISMKQLLESGVHFGHQSSKWHPKMAPYIFTKKSGIHIIDLQQTVRLAKEAHDFVQGVSANGGKVMFVGTKKQAADVIREEADRCGMYHVTNRWLGGMLTNFATIKKSIARYNELAKVGEDGGTINVGTKKERLRLEKLRQKMARNFEGIKSMASLPQVLYVIDPRKERIAVAEANKLGIPVVAVVDTNCDPTPVDYVIPGNDDSIRSIKIFTASIADAVVSGIEMGRLSGGGRAEAPAEQAEGGDQSGVQHRGKRIEVIKRGRAERTEVSFGSDEGGQVEE